MRPFQIAPSLLAADFAQLGAEAKAVLAAGADMLHLDVMDNHYVPNLTVGPLVCQALRKAGITAPIDVHLMVKPVDRMIQDFVEAGASHIIFHPEASEHIDASLSLIKAGGCKAGLALNPATPPQILEYVLDKIDIVLVMSVNPGFGGQKLIPSAYQKIADVKALIGDRDIRIAVDGGIKLDNIAEAARAGADMFILGTAIFGQPDYRAVIEALHQTLAHL